VRSLRRHGISGGHEYGYNSLIPEDHAHQLLLILKKFDKLQRKRQKVYQRYQANLQDFDFVKTREGTTSSHHKLVMKIKHRNELREHLTRSGIETKIHYTTTLDKKSGVRYGNAETLCAQSLSLPIYPHLKNDEIDYVCEKIKGFKDV
jgi:dTDP-4-amino-4,6-dideoxygalactose transaminase